MASNKHEPASDSKLIQIVDAALLLAAEKSGAWLACKPGCSQCCVGVFAINPLDAARLRDGLAELASRDLDRAERVRRRAAQSWRRLIGDFPGDPVTGALDEDSEAFQSYANDEPCPVLDPETGTCDLYAARPMTCRVFGPPVRSDDGLGVCELCYHGATPEEIASCEMIPDPDGLESRLVEKLVEDSERRGGATGMTLVAFALTS
jgi:Fe-S-cluster containining protein